MQPVGDLLGLVCRRVAMLAEPACVKDSELRYVVVNEAFAGMFGLDVPAFGGRTDKTLGLLPDDDRKDNLERRALVFAEDGDMEFVSGRTAQLFRLLIEQFVTEAGDIYIFEHFVCEPALLAANEDAREVRVPEPVAAKPAPSHPAAMAGAESATIQDLLEHAVAHLDAGLMIVDPQDRVVYVNETMQQIYEGFIGRVSVGETLQQLLMRSAAQCQCGHLEGMCADERAEWVRKREQAYRRPFFEQVAKVGNGRWLHIVNRRLDNGYMVGLRRDATDVRTRDTLLLKQQGETSLYKAILDALPVPVFARDENHLMTYSNEASCRILGKPREALAGRDEVAVFGEGAKPFFEENEGVLKTGKISVTERLIPHADGTVMPVMSRISRTELPDGKRYIVGSMMDVSSLKEREREIEEARESAEKAKADLLEILNNADYGVLVIRQDDLVVELANDLVLSQWAMTSLKDIIGRSFLELLDYNFEHQVFEQTYEEHVRGKALWARQIRQGKVPLREVLSTSGISILIKGRPLSGGRLILTYSDISEIRRRDREINDAKSQLAETGRLMNEALAAIDRGMLVVTHGTVAIYNDAVRRLLDLPDGLLEIGQDWASAFAYCAKRGDFGDDPISVVARLHDAAQKQEFTDLTFQAAGERWIKLEVRPAKNRTTIAFLTDITETLNRQTELETLVVRAEKADRAKSEFLANVSQSIRTPMNGVLGMAELLSRSQLDTRQKAFVEAIAKSGRALLTVINDILDFSEIDQERLELRASNFDPLASIDDIVGLMASKAEEKDIELVVRHASDIPLRVRADALRFRQTVFNLVRNAIRFTEKGHVEVELANAAPIDGKPAISVAVRDTGIGIPNNRLQMIFEKFARVDGASRSRYEGIGLGLAIAHGLVRMMGGNIDVTSEPGKGSTFTVTVPVETVEAHGSGHGLAGPLADGRILLVEPGEASRNAVKQTLEGWGLDVDCAQDTGQALAILDAASTVDVPIVAAIVNSVLEDQSGPELIRVLRADPRFGGLPVILMTKSDFGETDTLYRTDVQAHVPKPIRSSLLKSTLANVLSGARTPGPSAQGRSRPEPGDEAARPALHGGLDLLIAEDNEINALMYEQLLANSGYRFRIVKDGRLAVEAWRRERPKMIFMDIRMPVMDGLEATAAIRAEEAGTAVPQTPIIGVTSHADEETYDACKEVGMDDNLPKPLSRERLFSKISDWSRPEDAGEEAGQVSQSA